MTVTSKWVALHEVSDYLAKGWREVQIIGGPDDAALMVSPEELASEPAKVECPNCRENTYPNRHDFPDGRYICQQAGTAKVEEPTDRPMDFNRSPFVKAQPEPAAAEMPEAVLVNTWQLEELLKYADLAEVSIRTGFAPPSFLGVDLPYLLRNAIAAVRAQAAEAGIKLPKVREGISLLIWKIDNAQGAIAVEHYSGMLRSMLAELDTAEGRK